MNANQIVNMVVRLLFRRVLHRGIDAGIDRLAGKGKRAEDMTSEERKQAQLAKQSGKRARQALRAGRKIGRL